MKTIELLERAWKWHKQGNNDIAWHDVHAALLQLREEAAAQQSQADAPPEVVMTYEQFHQSVVLSYINHDGDPIKFFDEVVAALNQYRAEKQAAQHSVEPTLKKCPSCGADAGDCFVWCPRGN